MEPDYTQPQYPQHAQPYAPQQQQQYAPQPYAPAPQQYQQAQPVNQYQHFPQAQQYAPQTYNPQVNNGNVPPVMNTRGYASLREDWSLSGIICIDVAWLHSLLTRYQQGDTSLIDADMQGYPTGKLKLSVSAKYSPSQSGKSTHKLTLYNRADLPPR